MILPPVQSRRSSKSCLIGRYEEGEEIFEKAPPRLAITRVVALIFALALSVISSLRPDVPPHRHSHPSDTLIE